jgi:hypothetical protein
MQVTKLSDFLKAQGLTPDGSKSTYQAFIDNFDKDYFDKAYEAEYFRTNTSDAVLDAFQWDSCSEDYNFWDMIDNKWREVPNPENDMLWLLDGKEPPKETDMDRMS